MLVFRAVLECGIEVASWLGFCRRRLCARGVDHCSVAAAVVVVWIFPVMHFLPFVCRAAARWMIDVRGLE